MMEVCALVFLAAAVAPGAPCRAQATVTGTVFDSLRTNAWLASPTVVIPELALYATADARGRFRFDSVPAGRYTLTFLHPSLDAIDVAAPVVALTVPERGSTHMPLATPSPAALYRRLCPTASSDTASGFLLGRVRDVDDASPLGRAIVTAEWTEYGLEHGKLKPHAARTSAGTTATGAYVLCGVPADVESEVFAFANGYAAGPIPVSLALQPFFHLNLAVSVRDSAARFTPEQLVDTLRGHDRVATAPGRAVVTGTTMSTQGGAIVTALANVVGTDAAAHVDSAGRFRLAAIPAGSRAVQVRALGMAPITFAMDLRADATVDTTIRLDKRAQTLAGVEVLGERGAARDPTGFEERKKVSVGRFLTAAELEKRPTTEIATALERLTALHIKVDMRLDPSGKFLIYMRGGEQSKNGHMSNTVHWCLPTFFVDGVSFGSSVQAIQSVRDYIQVSDIRGVEAYTAGEIIPPQFDRSNVTGCGSVIIWSK